MTRYNCNYRKLYIRKGVQLFRRTDERRFRRSIFSIVSEGGMVKLGGKKGKKKKKISVTIDENLFGGTKRWPQTFADGIRDST